jgi:hypothetical protein
MRPAPSAATPAVRDDRTMARFLIGGSVTLLPMPAAVVALQLGWSRLGATASDPFDERSSAAADGTGATGTPTRRSRRQAHRAAQRP